MFSLSIIAIQYFIQYNHVNNEISSFSVFAKITLYKRTKLKTLPLHYISIHKKTLFMEQ